MSSAAPTAWEIACHDQLQATGLTDLLFWMDRAAFMRAGDTYLDAVISFAPIVATDNSFEHGVWYFQFGTNGSAANFGRQELAFGSLFQEVHLLRASTSQTPVQRLRHGRFSTAHKSLGALRASVLQQCASWPASLLREIAAHGKLTNATGFRPSRSAEHFKKVAAHALWLVARPYRQVKLAGAKIRRVFTYQQWNIGVVHAPIHKFLDSSFKPKVEWFDKPKWPISLADPFPVRHQDKVFLMAELFDFTKGRGEISALELKEWKVDRSVRSLCFPFHMSYPCMIESDGVHYCLSETLQTNELTIYRCESFPNMWVRHSIVQNQGAYADPTLFRHGEHWWVLATCFDQASGGNASLHAWFSQKLDGPWTPHAANPIKVDVESSRSAGTPFEYEGRLYRPAQNCARKYGGSVMLNLISTLTPEKFQEQPVRELRPDKIYPHAFHHLSQFGDVTFVDGRRDYFYPLAAVVKILRLLDKKPATVNLSWGSNTLSAEPRKILSASSSVEIANQENPR